MIKINSINTLYLPVYDVLVHLILLHDVVVVKLVEETKKDIVCRKYIDTLRGKQTHLKLLINSVHHTRTRNAIDID